MNKVILKTNQCHSHLGQKGKIFTGNLLANWPCASSGPLAVGKGRVSSGFSEKAKNISRG